MANTVINTPELLNLDSTTGATVLAKGTVNERPATPTFSVDYLVVAGGGGGSEGGGGAGGLRTSYGSTTGGGGSSESTLALVASTNYLVTVGAGGTGGTSAAGVNQGSSGQNSVFSDIISTGGGYGGGSLPSLFPGATGGSGGGGRRDGGSSGGAAVTTPVVQGYGGGTTTSGPWRGGGGGGGANQIGQPGGGTGSSSGETGGDGGDGLAVSITGSSVPYAGGGGGGVEGTGGIGTGGTGGGGNGGGQSLGSPTFGSANTGGGGGGTSKFASNAGGGGSGVVILRYPNTKTITIPGTLTATTTTVSTDKVTTFTAGTGTISFSGTVVGGENKATDGTLRFNTDINKTEYFDGTGWYEIVDEYASGFIGPGTNYFDTKLYTGNGVTQSIGGYINGSGSFNGSSSKIEINSNLNIANNSFSFSFWIACTDSINDNYVIITEGSNGSNKNLHIGRIGSSSWTSVGKMRFGFYANDVDSTTNVSTDGTWQHWVCTFDASSTTQKIYLNGVLDNTRVASSNFTGTSNLQIGGLTDWASNNEFNGSIDQVRVYDTALSSTDIMALYGETAATATTAAFPSGQTAIATYTMDTSANGLLTTTDLSTVDYPAGAGCIALYEMNGNSNDTSNTYNGTPTNITYEGGAFDQAAVFNGSSSWIDTTLKNQYIGSISVWFKGSSGFDFLYSSQNGGSSGRGVALQINTNGTITVIISQGVQSNNALVVATTDTFFDNSWHNAVLTWDLSLSGTNTYLYVDNQIKASGAATTGNWTSGQDSSHNLILGNYTASSTSYVFNGSIDQVRVFNTALTGAQVTTLARGIATSYSGAATDVNFNGHLDFQPDFVWIKSRTNPSNGIYHTLMDSVRGQANGFYKSLFSNSTDQEDIINGSAYTQAVNGGVSSFDTNGFTLSNGSGASDDDLNVSSYSYVAWNWKAGGAAVSNTDGTITSQVSANKDSGFSIVKFDGYQSSGTTVGHGLNSTPELIIAKNLDQTTSWPVWFDDAITMTSTTFTLENSTKYLALNSTTGYISYTLDRQFGGTLSGGSGDEMIAYCFHSVAGYSKIGSYTGTGATGNVINVGFKPRFILLKNTSSGTNGDGWFMFDTTRSGSDVINVNLQANTSDAESGPYAYTITVSSTGFEPTGSFANFTGTNASGGTYIYLAIA